MHFLRGFIHLRVEVRTAYLQNCDTETCVNGKKSFSFKIKQTPWIMNKYLFLLVFDAVDIFQSNIGTLPQLRMFFEL